jgi:integrase
MDCATPFALRDFTILLLAASYGLRRSELAALSLDNIDWRPDNTGSTAEDAAKFCCYH